MDRIVVSQLGDPEQLKLVSAPEPQPGPDEVLVKVEAAGINYMDVYQRTGIYKAPLPYTPGIEGTGKITAVGPGVQKLRVGQRIAWLNVQGSYAQAMVIPVRQAIALPDTLETANGLLIQAVTVQFLMTEYRALRPGDWVLVHAAAGGVGQLLVQWAKHLGATVVGTASSAKIHFVRALGADYVIDYSKSDFHAEVMKLTQQRGVDVAFDSVGRDTFERSVQSLARGGTAVCYGMASGPAPKIDPASLMAKALRVAGGSIMTDIADVERLHTRSHAALEAITAGWLNLGTPSSYPLQDASRAHADLESRRTQGKLMLVP